MTSQQRVLLLLLSFPSFFFETITAKYTRLHRTFASSTLQDGIACISLRLLLSHSRPAALESNLLPRARCLYPVSCLPGAYLISLHRTVPSRA
ncbi:hypothetical protein F4808DRAFT_423410 [Astrocystis sublimbata]|nr:hypothetical protein F4808DRAFT_423410 [Astrocystis sublimbata]